MSAAWSVVIEGDALNLMLGLDRDSRALAASQAINKVTASTRTELARRIRAEINLPASYVAPAQGRLAVTRFASPTQLLSTITARGRATSLARFVTSASALNKPGVGVSVSPGRSVFLKSAFLIRLPGIGGETDALKGNIALAVRLPRGARMKNKNTARVGKSGLYVLYGPSVAQAFENNSGSGLKQNILPEVANDLGREFLRLISRSRNA